MNHDLHFTMVAKTLYGLEDVLAAELTALGAEEVTIGRRMVSFRGDKRMLYLANLRLRTALRVLKPVVTFRAKTADEIYERLRAFDWTTVMSVDQTFSIDSVVYSDTFKNSQYISYRTKDALVDYFREHMDKRPSVRLSNPDILLNIHVSHDEVTLSLDSSGESLHKRGYRVAETVAPLNEVLAAGILLKAGWDGSTDLIDPMCGSGTFLIEAALIACNIAPGIYRRGFAFERWADFDARLFDELYHDDSAERAFDHTIYGSDILPQAIGAARKNVERAGLGRYISLSVMPMSERPKPEGKAMLVMNPPYGERIRVEDMQELYSMIGERLKHNYPGCSAWVLAFKPEHFNQIGLRQSHREKLMNGALECELRGYELFEGRREEFAERKKNYPTEDRSPRAEGRAERPPRREGEGGRPPRRDRDDRFAGDRERSPRRQWGGGREEREGGERRHPFDRREDRPDRRQTDDTRPRRAPRPDRAYSDNREERDGERRPYARKDEHRAYGQGEDNRPRRARSDKPFAREDRVRREERNNDRPEQNAWPSDRFRSTDESGRSRRKSSPSIQVIRNEETKND